MLFSSATPYLIQLKIGSGDATTSATGIMGGTGGKGEEEKITFPDSPEPIFVRNEHFIGHVHLRLARNGASYFQGKKRQFSLQWQGMFLPTCPDTPDGCWTAEDVWFKAETQEGLQLPYGTSLVIQVIRYIDPAFYADEIYSQNKPWAGSWVTCSMNIMKSLPAPPELQELIKEEDSASIKKASDYLSKYWKSNGLEEDTSLALSVKERRRHFLSCDNRCQFKFLPDQVYAFDFYNDLFDIATMSANMGISFSIATALKNQPLRFSVCSVKHDVTFFTMEINYSE